MRLWPGSHAGCAVAASGEACTMNRGGRIPVTRAWGCHCGRRHPEDVVQRTSSEKDVIPANAGIHPALAWVSPGYFPAAKTKQRQPGSQRSLGRRGGSGWRDGAIVQEASRQPTLRPSSQRTLGSLWLLLRVHQGASETKAPWVPVFAGTTGRQRVARWRHCLRGEPVANPCAVIPAKAGIPLALASGASGCFRNKSNMGPSVRWDDGGGGGWRDGAIVHEPNRRPTLGRSSQRKLGSLWLLLRVHQGASETRATWVPAFAGTTGRQRVARWRHRPRAEPTANPQAVIPAKAGIALALAPGASGCFRNKSNMGPSIRWDDGAGSSGGFPPTAFRGRPALRP